MRAAQQLIFAASARGRDLIGNYFSSPFPSCIYHKLCTTLPFPWILRRVEARLYSDDTQLHILSCASIPTSSSPFSSRYEYKTHTHTHTHRIYVYKPRTSTRVRVSLKLCVPAKSCPRLFRNEIIKLLLFAE